MSDFKVNDFDKFFPEKPKRQVSSSSIDFKEYTRIRDIVVKRNKRAAAAGLAPLVHFPTVKEIRAGYVPAKAALQAVKGFYSDGTTVKAIRQTGLAPVFKSFPQMPAQPKISEELKKERRREQQRLYRRMKKVRDSAISPEKAKKYEGYLKALDTVSRTWRKKGVDIGISVRDLTPAEAQAFVEYLDYRFSQGDFTQQYVIDEFIQDFSKLMKKGHNAQDIVSDFNQFLENRSRMTDRASNMEGISEYETMGLWSEFVGD